MNPLDAIYDGPDPASIIVETLADALERVIPNLKIDSLGGVVPTQGEGIYEGQEFYYRARGESASLGVGGDPIGRPDRSAYIDGWGWPEAGYLDDLDTFKAFYWLIHNLQDMTYPCDHCSGNHETQYHHLIMLNHEREIVDIQESWKDG